MKSAPFVYERAESVEDMLNSLGANGGSEDSGGTGGTEGTVLLAGGQSLVPLLHARSVRPRQVLDIDGLTELEYLDVDRVNGGLRIGALCRHATLERSVELIGPWAAWLTAARLVGLHPVRQRGTLGGSLADAHPGAELALAGVTYDAVVLLRSRRGERLLPVAELLLGPHLTALHPDEAIVGLRVDERAPGTVSAFTEVSRRAVGWPLASVCAVIRLEGSVVAEMALGVGAVGSGPRRLTDAERLLVGERLDDSAIAGAAATAARAADDLGEPAYDVDVDVEARRELVGTLVRRTLGYLRATRVAG